MSRYLINAGEFKHVVTIQDQTGSTNSYGEATDEDWTDFSKTRAGIYPISGREFFFCFQVNSEITHKVNMRYISGVKPNMRIKFNDRFFEIISVINFQEGNKLLQLLCKELI